MRRGRLGDQVERIVCWGAPVYPDMSTIDDALANTGPMTRLFAANTAWARAACQWNCSHRTLAGWVAAMLAPSIPVPIARAASLHSWPAYRDAMDCLVGGTDWSNLAGKVTAGGASLKLVWGDSDRIGDRGYAASLIGAELEVVEGAGHHLLMTHASLCVSQLESR